jgi:hypothetical protein
MRRIQEGNTQRHGQRAPKEQPIKLAQRHPERIEGWEIISARTLQFISRSLFCRAISSKLPAMR